MERRGMVGIDKLIERDGCDECNEWMESAL